MKPLESGSSSAFGGTMDGELFALMANRGVDAREAWAELYRRYVADFHRLVCRLRGLSVAGAEELVQETMIQAYKSAHTFKAGEGLDRESSRRRTLAWLGRVARNLHYEMLRKQKVTLVFDADRQRNRESAAEVPSEASKIAPEELYRRIREAEVGVREISHASGAQPSDERRLLRDALATLTERDLDILLVSYEYYEPGESNPHLPRAVIAELCERHNVSATNLRKIRERARKQIWQYIQSNTPA